MTGVHARSRAKSHPITTFPAEVMAFAVPDDRPTPETDRNRAMRGVVISG